MIVSSIDYFTKKKKKEKESKNGTVVPNNRRNKLKDDGCEKKAT